VSVTEGIFIVLLKENLMMMIKVKIEGSKKRKLNK